MHATYEHVKDHGPVKERVKRSRRPSRLCPFNPIQPNTSPQFHYEPGVQVSTSELLLTGVQRYRGLGYLIIANTYKMYDPQVTQETRLDSLSNSTGQCPSMQSGPDSLKVGTSDIVPQLSVGSGFRDRDTTDSPFFAM